MPREGQEGTGGSLPGSNRVRRLAPRRRALRALSRDVPGGQPKSGLGPGRIPTDRTRAGDFSPNLSRIQVPNLQRPCEVMRVQTPRESKEGAGFSLTNNATCWAVWLPPIQPATNRRPNEALRLPPRSGVPQSTLPIQAIARAGGIRAAMKKTLETRLSWAVSEHSKRSCTGESRVSP